MELPAISIDSSREIEIIIKDTVRNTDDVSKSVIEMSSGLKK